MAEDGKVPIMDDDLSAAVSDTKDAKSRPPATARGKTGKVEIDGPEAAGRETIPGDVMGEQPAAAGGRTDDLKGKQSAVLDEKYMRLYAEFENYKKRVAREKAEMLEYSCEGLVRGLLPVLDDLDAHLKHSNDEGIAHVAAKLRKALGEHGLEVLNPIGKVFSPDIAEAVQVRASSKEEDGRIVEVVQKGYGLKGKVLRYPKVVVGKC